MGQQRATRRQIVIEREYGKPLPQVVDELLYDRNLTHERAARRLGIDPATLWRWRRSWESNGAAPAAELAALS